MKPEILEDEHLMFRDAFRKFVQVEITPYHEQWEQDRIVSREVWQKAGEAGFLCMDIPEQYGGIGEADYRYSAIITEELARAGATGIGFSIHTDMVVPYITRFGTEDQKGRWLPKTIDGGWIGAVAMTERPVVHRWVDRGAPPAFVPGCIRFTGRGLGAASGSLCGVPIGAPGRFYHLSYLPAAGVGA